MINMERIDLGFTSGRLTKTKPKVCMNCKHWDWEPNIDLCLNDKQPLINLSGKDVGEWGCDKFEDKSLER